MENQYGKWVNLSYLAASALMGYVVFAISLRIVGSFDIEARIRSINLIVQIGSVGVAGLTFLLLYTNAQANQFMNEVVVELSRVTWPTQKETSSGTVVVIIMVLISGMILGLLDYCWTQLLKWVV